MCIVKKVSGLAWLCVRLNDQSPEKNSQVNLVSLLDVFFFFDRSGVFHPFPLLYDVSVLQFPFFLPSLFLF